jgi:hypothetical protein
MLCILQISVHLLKEIPEGRDTGITLRRERITDAEPDSLLDTVLVDTNFLSLFISI